MRHQEDGLLIRVHDCVLVRSGVREKPFVAKITALYEENGELALGSAVGKMQRRNHIRIPKKS